MLSRQVSKPIIFLMLMLTVLKKLWTGTIIFLKSGYTLITV